MCVSQIEFLRAYCSMITGFWRRRVVLSVHVGDFVLGSRQLELSEVFCGTAIWYGLVG